MENFRTFHEYNIEKLTNPDDAKTYLEVALDEYRINRDSGAFLIALRDIAESQGGISQLAKRAGMDRQSLHNALSDHESPTIDTLDTILRGLGFQLAVEPLSSSSAL